MNLPSDDEYKAMQTRFIQSINNHKKDLETIDKMHTILEHVYNTTPNVGDLIDEAFELLISNREQSIKVLQQSVDEIETYLLFKELPDTIKIAQDKEKFYKIASGLSMQQVLQLSIKLGIDLPQVYTPSKESILEIIRTILVKRGTR